MRFTINVVKNGRYLLNIKNFLHEITFCINISDRIFIICRNFVCKKIKLLAARGISGFTEMLKHYEAHSPLKRNVAPEELGATGTFLASDGAAAITGQVLYVDCGYQIMGM